MQQVFLTVMCPPVLQLFSLAEDDDEDDEDDLVFSRTILGSGQAGRRPPFAVYWLATLSAVGGFLFGYDTGVVSGAMVLVRKDFRLDDIWHEVIVSATVAAAFVFSLVGAWSADRFGRRPTILSASVAFTVGSFLMGLAPGRWTLLLGRLVVGVGIGLSSMSVPVYIAEACPANRRGELVTLNNVFITGGQFAAGVVCGALSSSVEGWRYMLGLAAVPAVLQFFGFVGLPESPRYLVLQGKYDEAYKVLSKLRNEYDNVHEELEDIKVTAIRDSRSAGSCFEILRHRGVRRALFVGCSLQLFQQLSGINTVMYYSATIIQLAGFGDAQSAIWLAAATAFVNFMATFVGLYYVDKKGRRPLLFASLWGVVVSLLVLSGSFILINRQASEILAPGINSSTSSALSEMSPASCPSAASCYDCIEELEGCGFCLAPSRVAGECIPLKRVIGNISVPEQCPNSLSPPSHLCPAGWLSWLPVIGLCLYLLCFSPGMGPLPWTINSEIYPTWARSACTGVATSVNWVTNLFVSLTFLTLLDLMGKPGTFFMYACLGTAGLVLFFFRLPETSGLSLEETETLFLEPGEEGYDSSSKRRASSQASSNFSVAYSRISNPLDAD